MGNLISGVLMFLFGSIGVWCLLFAYALLTGDGTQYERNRQNILRGKPVSDVDLRATLKRPWRPGE